MKFHPRFHYEPPRLADPGSENDIQFAFCQAMRKLAPDVRIVAVPNGQKRTRWQAAQAKREGLSKGFPDVMALWGHGAGRAPVSGMAMIEFKSKDGTLSDDQKEQLDWLHDHGFAVAVCRSVAGAVAFLRGCQAPILRELA